MKTFLGNLSELLLSEAWNFPPYCSLSLSLLSPYNAATFQGLGSWTLEEGEASE